MSFHGLLGILVVGVPPDAHHHLMHVPTANTGPTTVDAGGQLSGKVVHHLFGEVGRGDAQLLGAAAEAPHHRAAAEVGQVPHDAVRAGRGPRVPRARRRCGRGSAARILDRPGRKRPSATEPGAHRGGVMTARARRGHP